MLILIMVLLRHRNHLLVLDFKDDCQQLRITAQELAAGYDVRSVSRGGHKRHRHECKRIRTFVKLLKKIQSSHFWKKRVADPVCCLFVLPCYLFNFDFIHLIGINMETLRADMIGIFSPNSSMSLILFQICFLRSNRMWVLAFTENCKKCPVALPK